MRSEATQSLLQVPLFRQLDEREQSLLQSMVRVRRYRVRRVVYNQGDVSDALFFIVSGYVKSGRLGSTGRPPLTTVCGPGEIVGEMSLLDGGRRGSTVSVLEDAELLVISREVMMRLLESSPSLARSMLQLTARRFRSLTDRFESISSLGVPERLAGAVLKLAKKYGLASPNGEVTIPIRLSQQDLGSLVGTCRETVNKMLRLWTERRLIRQESGRIVITDVCQFKHFSEGGARPRRGDHHPVDDAEGQLPQTGNCECG